MREKRLKHIFLNKRLVCVCCGSGKERKSPNSTSVSERLTTRPKRTPQLWIIEMMQTRKPLAVLFSPRAAVFAPLFCTHCRRLLSFGFTVFCSRGEAALSYTSESQTFFGTNKRAGQGLDAKWDAVFKMCERSEKERKRLRGFLQYREHSHITEFGNYWERCEAQRRGEELTFKDRLAKSTGLVNGIFKGSVHKKKLIYCPFSYLPPCC